MKRRCRNIANLFAIGRAPRLASLAIAAVCALWAIGCFTINLYQGAGPDAQKAPGGAMMAAPKDNLQAPEKKPAAPESKPATPGTLKADKSVKLFMEVKPFSKKDWKYQRKITLTNNWRDLRDYTAKIIVPHRQGMSADYADLRFTEAKDKEVPYWIEEANEKSAVVWVRIPQLEAESDTMIHLHYGCEETASAGNGRAAFLFFDDFSKGFDGELWERGRDGSDGGVGADAANGAMNVWIGDGNHPDGWAKTRQQFEPPLTVESRIKLTRKGMFAANVCGAHLLMMPGDVNRGGYPLGVNYHYYMGASGFPYMSLCRNCFISTREAGAVPEPRTRLEPFWDGVWFRQQLSYDAKSARDNLLYIRSNGLKTERFVDITLSTSKPLAAYFGGFAWGGPTLCISVDWVAVRRYAPEEPKAIIED